MADASQPITYKRVFNDWMPQLKELLTEYKRAGIPQYVFQHRCDRTMEKSELEAQRTQLELAIGEEEVNKIINGEDFSRTTSIAYNPLKDVAKKLDQGYKFFESSYYLDMVMDEDGQQNTLESFFYQLALLIPPETNELEVGEIEDGPKTVGADGSDPIAQVPDDRLKTDPELKKETTEQKLSSVHDSSLVGLDQSRDPSNDTATSGKNTKAGTMDLD